MADECTEFFDTYVGIDPGLSGGVVAFRMEDKTPTILLSIAIDKLEGETFLEKVEYILDDLHSIGAFNNTRIAMEMLPTAHPGQRGVNSAKTMGINWGLLRGALMCLGQDIEIVTPMPKKWQDKVLGKHEGIPTDEATLSFVKNVIPTLELHPMTKRGPSKNYHDGLVDAACLAWYAMVTADE